jgi:dynein light intermediate chain 1
LEQLKQEDEKDRATKQVPQLEMSPLEDNGRVNEHIGPVQFNMGGIQVDADDMLRKLKVSYQINLNEDVLQSFANHSQEREASRVQRKEVVSSPGDEKAHNQALANFFAGLVKKPGTSPRGSPSA